MQPKPTDELDEILENTRPGQLDRYLRDNRSSMTDDPKAFYYYMKNVLAEQDKVNTLIFDEVDTGVSGRAAQKVAEKLRSVAVHKQVLCVTHLPQLAALANTHLLIAKSERDGRTYTSVTPLDIEGRKRELARIIGGTNITETTLKSAEEMLSV